ncbi:MAG: hypothetical protein ABI867_22105 [Kofleriaceae bacterium]
MPDRAFEGAMQRLVVLLGVLTSTPAIAHPPPPIEIARDPVPEPRSPFQWSTWVRLAVGSESQVSDVATRGTPPARERSTVFEAAVGTEITFGIDRAGHTRVGPWLEVRGLELGEIVAGGELVIQAVPAKLDMFWYEGQGILAIRAGGNHERITSQVSYGYQAPWHLSGPPGHYKIGLRMVGTVTRELDDARTWTATLGLETEPVGALRYLLGIRSWYR